MFQKRTDLALEVHELHGEDSGIIVEEQEKDGIRVTSARIKEGKGEKTTGKPAGRYITVDTGEIWRLDRQGFEKRVQVLSHELSSLLPQGKGCILVVGLGNEAITPDSIGPRTIKKLLVTRHINDLDPVLYESAGFGCIAALSPGVLGQTGIETAEIIKSVCESIRPKCVIAIDALASRRLSRLATTVQISDVGISPGSGVSNRRGELSQRVLGAPVISMGVPTVVDAATLAHDLLEEHGGVTDDCFADIAERIFGGGGKNMFVTPKDNDIIAAKTAGLLAASINVAVHRMSVSEINEYVD